MINIVIYGTQFLFLIGNNTHNTPKLMTENSILFIQGEEMSF